MSVEPQTDPESARDGWRWTLWIFAGIFVLTALNIVVFKLEITTADEWPRSVGWNHFKSERLSMVLGMVGTACVLAYGILRGRVDLTRGRRALAVKVIIAALVVVAGLNYFGRRAGKRVYLHTWDTYHYVLGAKYFDELDYFYLYDCTAEALGPALIADDTKVRDLRDYWWVTAAESRAAHGEECRARFSEERWEEFRADLQLFVDVGGRRYVRDMLADHGYNGTPFHTLVAGTLSNLFPLSLRSLTLAILLDVAALLIALAVVCRTFSWRVGMLFAFIVFTLALDRFAVTGCSFVRYWWLVAIMLGVCALHRGRWATAGSLLTIASAFVVFPVTFVAGAGLALLGDAWRRRSLTRPLKRFVLGMAVTGILAGAAGAAHGHGLRNYTLFEQDMQVHVKGQAHEEVGHLVRNPGYGVGLKFIFYYRGEHSTRFKGPDELEFARQVNEISPYIVTIGVALTAFAGLIAWRLRAAEAAPLFGLVTFFSLLGTTGYYFSCGSLLMLALFRRRFAADGILLIALFMAISAHALVILDTTKVAAVMYRTYISTTWLIFLCVLMWRFAGLTGLLSKVAAPFRGDADAQREAWPERAPAREP